MTTPPYHPDDLFFAEIPPGFSTPPCTKTEITDGNAKHIVTVIGTWNPSDHASVFADLLNAGYALGCKDGRRALAAEIARSLTIDPA